MTTHKYAIVVAGGKGLRMGADTPKQFLPIGGKPVLMRTLERFREALPDVALVLVLPPSQQDFWRQLCVHHHFTLPHTVASGGATRFHSVSTVCAPSQPIWPKPWWACTMASAPSSAPTLSVAVMPRPSKQAPQCP